MKKHKFICLAITIFIICFVYHFFFSILGMDEIWNYGFSYNISTGLIPYKDFNMIITPFYSYLLAILIYIFGNHIILLSILNSLIATTIFIIGYRFIGKKMLIFLPMILLFIDTSYNLLSLMVFMLIMFVDAKKIRYKDFILGLICSILILTKQTVGALVFIPLFLYSKNKKQLLFGVLPLCLIFLIYLFFSHSLFGFIDYCFLGMFSFTSKNGLGGHFEPSRYVYFGLLIFIIYLVILKKCKDKELSYILAYQIMAFPILDVMHITIAVIPFLIYLFAKLSIKSHMIIILGVICTLAFFTNSFSFVKFSNYHIYKNKESYLYGRGMWIDYSFVKNIYKYIDENYNNSYVFNFSEYSYLLKLENNKQINKYDLINNGNMGYKGEKKYIKEVKSKCKRKRCVFIIDDNIKDSQTSKGIINYVKKYGTYDLQMDGFSIYYNK